MEDLIGGLPDELLHIILLRLRSTRAAAQTSLLSRRWRRLWTNLPEIFVDAASQPKTTILDAVDGALAACSAPAVDRLDVSINCTGLRVRASQVEPWLRFASNRQVRTLHVDVPPQKRWRILTPKPEREEEELELPVWNSVTSITLKIDYGWHLKLLPAGMFTALIDIEIKNATVDSSELGTLVSSRCPSLRNLSLCIKLVVASNISMRSESLQSLSFRIQNAKRLEVDAPKLEAITIHEAIGLHISAPELAKVTWNGNVGYNPHSHQLINVARHLKLLESDSNRVVWSLVQRFDEVEELVLNVDGFSKGPLGLYTSFLTENITLPKSETLHISLGDYHSFASGMLHLLRICNRTRKLSVNVGHSADPLQKTNNSCPLSCHCRLPMSTSMSDGVNLSLLEEVEIRCFRSSHGELQFLETLSRCTAQILEKLVIYTDPFEKGTSLTKEICKKIRTMFRPNLDVIFIMYSDDRLVRFD